MHGTMKHDFGSYSVGARRPRRTTAKAFAKNVSVDQERKCGAQRRLDTFVVLYPKRYPPAIRLRTNVTRRAALPGKPEFRLRGKYGCKAET
ncbi:hypothetical protein TNCV_2698981 [Trichonephila clavipes]|nr:hypothetical protein TNCV_2698981 [Trichonephila clavipes]